jgi:nucleoside phosphorylase
VHCALPIEAKSAARRLRRGRRGSLGLFPAWDGTLAGVPVVIVVSGRGVSEAGIAAREAIRLLEPRGLIVFGAAGALVDTWSIGQCGLLEAACSYKPPRVIPPPGAAATRPRIFEAAANPEWLKAGEQDLGLPCVRIGSADKPVLNRYMAQHLATAYGFDWADCESYAALNVAIRGGIPAIGLRTVTDHCGPDAVEQFTRNAPEALQGAALQLEELVAALVKAGLLNSRNE